VPGLVTILVGANPASMSYVTLKDSNRHRVGFKEIQDSQPEDHFRSRSSGIDR
jgi:methylenetetrahydrofolate dehydrogenase (NADP+) / methenyltetrahydrofolate cyclohydrolase